MIESVLLVIGVLLAVSGLCEFIHTVRLLFILPKKCNKGINLLWLKKGKAISQLKFAYEQIRWYGNTYADHIIAVTSDLDQEELEECKKYTENSDIILCPSDVLSHIAECISEY